MENLEIERQNLITDMEKVIEINNINLNIIGEDATEFTLDTVDLLFLNDLTLVSLKDEQRFINNCENNPNYLNKTKELVSTLLNIMQKTHKMLVNETVN